MNIKSKTGHIIFKFHKRRERFVFTVKSYEFHNPEIIQIDETLKDVFFQRKDKYFQTFEYRCEYDINFEQTSGEVFFSKYLTVLNCQHKPRDCAKSLMKTK